MGPKSFLLGYVIFVLVFAAGCGSSQGPLSVAISPQDVAIGTGQTVQFTPIVTNDSSGVAWSATAGTIDANGNYTAPSGSPSMTVTVTATSVKTLHQDGHRNGQRGSAGSSDVDGQYAGGELYHFSCGGGKRFRAVWHRHELRPYDLDAAGTDGGRGGELVRGGDEGKHAVPHEGSGTVRRWDAIYGPGSDVHDAGPPGCSIAGDHDHDDAGA